MNQSDGGRVDPPEPMEVSPLVPTGEPRDRDLHSLAEHLRALEAVLAERDAELTRVRAEVQAFRIRYRQEVGLLHEELDELELALDEAERGVRAEAEAPVTGPSSATGQAPPSEPLPRYTADAVRKLFRDVAKAIHPDLARDERARDRRHTLMIEANRAYALGDEERLRAILRRWEHSPEAVSGSDDDAARLRLVRRIAQVEEQLGAYESDLAALLESPLGKLKTMVDEASASGRDLVAEMVRRLQRDILVARNRLDAILWRP